MACADQHVERCHQKVKKTRGYNKLLSFFTKINCYNIKKQFSFEMYAYDLSHNIILRR